MRERPLRSRRQRAAFAAPIDPFTITLLGFGLLTWILVLQTWFAGSTACHLAEIWLTGWLDGIAPLQLIGLSVFLFAAVYLVRLFTTDVWAVRRGEMLAQGVFIALLALSLGSAHAHFIPNGFPSDSFYASVLPPAPTLVADRERFSGAPWPYDYPPPPPHPLTVDITAPYRVMQAEGGTEMNPNRALIAGAAPTRAEMARISACRENYHQAETAMQDWERGFHDWLAAHPSVDDRLVSDPRWFTPPYWSER